MAQVGRTIRALALAAATLAAGPAAAEELPQAALRAEIEQRFDEALRLYREALPASADPAALWLRMADIHAVRQEPAAAAEALGHAAALRPEDAALQARWSQSLAAASRPAEALAAIRKAVALDPQNTAYLAAQAELADWYGDPVQAEQAYREWQQRSPGEFQPRLGLARLLARRGHLEAAVTGYGQALRMAGADPAARLELAAVHGYRGDFAAARRQLARYRRDAGDNEAYRQALAELQARAGRPQQALALLEPLLDQRPDDYELHRVRALALHQNRQPGQARQELRELDRLGPDRPETRGLGLQVGTPLRASVAARAGHYEDSTDLRQSRYGVSGGVQTGPRLRWLLAAGRVDTRAQSGSGLEAFDGRTDVAVDTASAGFHYLLSPGLQVEAQAGTFQPEAGASLTGYTVGVALWPVETVKVRLAGERDLLLVSPRAIALGIRRDRSRLALDGQFGDRGFLALEYNDDEYSDGNASRELLVGPRFAALRSAAWNVDLGLRGHWLEHKQDAALGYYSPRDFRRYWATGFVYAKLSDNAGVGLSLGYGLERDYALDTGFRRGGDASIEAVTGVFRDWQLRAWAGVGGRIDSAAFQAGTYHGRSGGIEILRRF